MYELFIETQTLRGGKLCSVSSLQTVARRKKKKNASAMAGLLIESPTQRRLQSEGVGRLKGHRDGLCLSPERAGAIRGVTTAAEGAKVFIRKTDKTQRQSRTQDVHPSKQPKEPKAKSIN